MSNRRKIREFQPGAGKLTRPRAQGAASRPRGEAALTPGLVNPALFARISGLLSAARLDLPPLTPSRNRGGDRGR